MTLCYVEPALDRLAHCVQIVEVCEMCIIDEQIDTKCQLCGTHCPECDHFDQENNRFSR